MKEFSPKRKIKKKKKFLIKRDKDKSVESKTRQLRKNFYSAKRGRARLSYIVPRPNYPSREKFILSAYFTLVGRCSRPIYIIFREIDIGAEIAPL